MDSIYAKQATPIIAGGTGFYIQSVVNDIDFHKQMSKPCPTTSRSVFEKYGGDGLHRWLEKLMHKVLQKFTRTMLNGFVEH